MQNIFLALATVLFFFIMECFAVFALSPVYMQYMCFTQILWTMIFNNSAFPMNVSGNLI